tara:strand:+ start:815 stop:2092 length:1278 start_codon:yes stop_codon:yes gene_type:complete
MNLSQIINEVIKKIGKDNTDTVFLIIIIVYFIYIFVLNFKDIIDFLISRYNIVSESIPTKTPYNDSLYMTYCNLSLNIDGTIIDKNKFDWFVHYLILFVFFWTNSILNKLSIDSMANEIKILGYSKYYNYDMTNGLEYVFLNFLSNYIIIVFTIVGYLFIYNSFYENNNMDKHVYKSMYNFSNEIHNNIIISPNDETDKKYEYYMLLNKKNVEESIKEFINNDNAKYDLLFEHDIDKRLKLLVTQIIATHNSFNNIRILTADKIENMFNNNCIYSYLSNPIKNVILPEYEDIPGRYLYTNPIKFVELKNDKIPDWTNIETTKIFTDQELKNKYNIFKEKIEEYSRDINKYHSDYTFKYKMWLILFSMSGLIVSCFAIIFFLFEFKYFRSLTGYINYKDFISSNFFTIIAILTVFILIVGAIIINL